MKIKQKIGVIGNGFVGGAVKFGFSPQVGCDAEVRVYDINPSKSTHTLEETVNKSDFIFLSVPTPANEDGSININILEDALKNISEVHDGKDNAVLIRSTVVPGTTWSLQQKYHKLSSDSKGWPFYAKENFAQNVWNPWKKDTFVTKKL